MEDIYSFLQSKFDNVVIFNINNVPTENLKGKLLLIHVDGMNTAREQRLSFLDNDYVFFYEPDPSVETAIASAFVKPDKIQEFFERRTICYYPKNDDVDEFFTSVDGIDFRRFSSIEGLIVSNYYQRLTEITNTYLFLQMISAYPNIDFQEICANLDITPSLGMDTRSIKKLYECAQRKEPISEFIQIVDKMESFPKDISQKFYKFKSVGIIGVTDFSLQVIKFLSDKMYIDVYDSSLSHDEIKQICPDATGNLKSVMSKCNALLVCKNIGLTEKDVNGKVIFDICNAFPEQTQKIKILGRKGWVIW